MCYRAAVRAGLIWERPSTYSRVHCINISSIHLRGTNKLTGEGLGDLLVDNDIDLDTTLGGGLEHPIKAVLLILGRRAAQVQLGTTMFLLFCVRLTGLPRGFSARRLHHTSATSRECKCGPWPLKGNQHANYQWMHHRVLPSRAMDTAQKYEAPSTYHLACPEDWGAKEQYRFWL